MVEPFFLAVTRTPSIGPVGAVTWPESPGSACATAGPRPEVASAIARLAAVDNSVCSIRIMITPLSYVVSILIVRRRVKPDAQDGFHDGETHHRRCCIERYRILLPSTHPTGLNSWRLGY